MSFSELARTGLPLNRKERYYTGTVLPMYEVSSRAAKLAGNPDWYTAGGEPRRGICPHGGSAETVPIA